MLALLIQSDALGYSWRGGGPGDEVVFSVEFEQVGGLKIVSYVYLSQKTTISAENNDSTRFPLTDEVNAAQSQRLHAGGMLF